MNTDQSTLWERAVLAALQGMFSNTDSLKKGTEWIVDHAINAANALVAKIPGALVPPVFTEPPEIVPGYRTGDPMPPQVHTICAALTP